MTATRTVLTLAPPHLITGNVTPLPGLSLRCRRRALRLSLLKKPINKLYTSVYRICLRSERAHRDNFYLLCGDISISSLLCGADYFLWAENGRLVRELRYEATTSNISGRVGWLKMQ